MRKPLVINWQARADAFVEATLRLAQRSAIDTETKRRIVANVRKSFAPAGYHEHCRHPERCAGNGYCREEIACNE